MRKLILTMLTMLLCLGVQAQENQYLHDLTEAVKGLRKGNDKVREQFVNNLSASNKPKITLMDDVKCEGDEFRGSNANRFRLNQTIVYVYGNQNQTLTSKDGGMLSSREQGIYYSAIEKSVKKGGSLQCSISGHVGKQEFSIVAYRPTARFRVTVSDGWHNPVVKEGVGNVNIESYRVLRSNTVTFTIDYIEDNSNKGQFESFAILNFNPQKR